MKNVSFVKKIASYFSEFLVEEVNSDLNGKLSVYYQYGHFVLNSENANYSFQNLHKVFQIGINHVAKNMHPKSILNLGMGAGSTLSIVRNELRWNAPIVSIEHDPKVIELARKYFGIEYYLNHEIHESDALVFLNKCSDQFEFILVDLFKDFDVPEKFLSSNFFKLLHYHVSERGIVLFNFVVKNATHEKKMDVIRTICRQNKFVIEELKIMKINRLLILKKGFNN